MSASLRVAVVAVLGTVLAGVGVAQWVASHLRLVLPCALLCCVVCSGVACSSPVAPGAVWVCSTQPRLYVLVDGTRQWEVDHYESSVPCPRVPIQ